MRIIVPGSINAHMDSSALEMFFCVTDRINYWKGDKSGIGGVSVPGEYMLIWQIWCTVNKGNYKMWCNIWPVHHACQCNDKHPSAIPVGSSFVIIFWHPLRNFLFLYLLFPVVVLSLPVTVDNITFSRLVTSHQVKKKSNMWCSWKHLVSALHKITLIHSLMFLRKQPWSFNYYIYCMRAKPKSKTLTVTVTMPVFQRLFSFSILGYSSMLLSQQYFLPVFEIIYWIWYCCDCRHRREQRQNN